MSDDDSKRGQTMMQIYATVAKDVYQDAVQPPMRTAGQVLDGIFKAIGHYPRLWGTMSDISLEAKQEQFREKLQSKVDKISEDNKILPKPNILGPSIQALEYGIFDDHLSEMFANLIASSMDLSKSKYTHPAFVEIVKQLDPHDAKLFKAAVDARANPLGIAKLEIKTGDYQSITSLEYIPGFLKDFSGYDLKQCVTSLDNLIRLGLLEARFDKALTNFEYYASIYDLLNSIPDIINGNRALYNPEDTIDSIALHQSYLIRGYLNTTSLGSFFAASCLSREEVK